MEKIKAKDLYRASENLEQMSLEDFMNIRGGDLDIEPSSEAMANLEKFILAQKPCPQEFLDFMNENMDDLFA